MNGWWKYRIHLHNRILFSTKKVNHENCRKKVGVTRNACTEVARAQKYQYCPSSLKSTPRIWTFVLLCLSWSISRSQKSRKEPRGVGMVEDNKKKKYEVKPSPSTSSCHHVLPQDILKRAGPIQQQTGTLSSNTFFYLVKYFNRVFYRCSKLDYSRKSFALNLATESNRQQAKWSR